MQASTILHAKAISLKEQVTARREGILRRRCTANCPGLSAKPQPIALAQGLTPNVLCDELVRYKQASLTRTRSFKEMHITGDYKSDLVAVTVTCLITVAHLPAFSSFVQRSNSINRANGEERMQQYRHSKFANGHI